jgi:hypothetical protein
MNDMTAARHDWLSPNPDEPLDRDGPRLCEVFQLDPAWLSTDRTGELIRFARGLMDRELSSWRLDMRTSKRVFASQVPEIWVALRRLLADEGKIPA